jgi:predicted nucleotidyltransferase
MGVHTGAVTDLARYADWVGWLQEQGRTDPDVLVVWVGGSAATGGWDEHSDLDVDVLCTPGTVADVYTRLVDRARARFEVADLWELPAGTWPDGRQCFVNLQARPGALSEPTRIIDLHLSDLADHHRFVDVRRHGRPIVLHDPDGLVVLRHDDDAEVWATLGEAVDQVRRRRVTGEWLVNRAIRRGHRGEATDLYLRFALAPVVRMVRVQHCPWRHDYGLRYLAEDLPADVAARIESLVPDGTLAAQSAACFAWLDELLAEPPVRGWPARRTARSPPPTSTRPQPRSGPR